MGLLHLLTSERKEENVCSSSLLTASQPSVALQICLDSATWVLSASSVIPAFFPFQLLHQFGERFAELFSSVSPTCTGECKKSCHVRKFG